MAMTGESGEAGKVALHESGALWFVHPANALEPTAATLVAELVKLLGRISAPETVYHDLSHVKLLAPEYNKHIKDACERYLGNVRNTICLIPNPIHKVFTTCAPAGQRWLIYGADKQALAALGRFTRK